MNFGSCQANGTGYICSCLTGFFGTNCQIGKNFLNKFLKIALNTNDQLIN